MAVKEVGEGPGEAGSGQTEEAFLRWLEEQGGQMEALKKGMDRKRKELARLGSWGQGTIRGQGSNQQMELSHGGSKVWTSSKAPSERGLRDTKLTKP